MRSLKEDYYSPPFSHIYIEKAVLSHSRTRKILERFPDAVRIEIDHYKDIFCRSRQNGAVQHRAQNLIIAQKKGELLYEGAPVCQSFGNQYFYYASCVMNCIYDCEYCYLKGMYPSGHMVVFVNLEDIFATIEKKLAQHELYLCVSYDTDLMALEHIIGYTAAWMEFAARHDRLKLEIRTKCANRTFFDTQNPPDNVIFAFTLSPQTVIEAYEHKTPGLEARIQCAVKALETGCQVRLCFDPMIYCADWRRHYAQMFDKVTAAVDWRRLVDVSVGSFRVSQEYLKKMRRILPDSLVIQFPFDNDEGVCQYPLALMGQMEQFLVDRLMAVLPEEKIFLWKK